MHSNNTNWGASWAPRDVCLIRGAQPEEKGLSALPTSLPWLLAPYKMFKVADEMTAITVLLWCDIFPAYVFIKVLHSSLSHEGFLNHPPCYSEVWNSKIQFLWTKICHINRCPDSDIFSHLYTEMTWWALGWRHVHLKVLSDSNFLLCPLGNWDNTLKLNLVNQKSLNFLNFCHKHAHESMRAEAPQ